MQLTRTFFSALIATLVVYSAPATAEIFGNNSCFNYPAVAMTPYNKSIQSDLYVMTHERVRHNKDKTGTILLYGPVNTFDPPAAEVVGLGLDYGYTVSGTGRASAIVQLRFVSDEGQISIMKTVRENIIGTADHETTPANATRSLYEVIPDSARLQRTDGYYMVRVYLNRNSSNIKLHAIGYKLCGGIT